MYVADTPQLAPSCCSTITFHCCTRGELMSGSIEPKAPNGMYCTVGLATMGCGSPPGRCPQGSSMPPGGSLMREGLPNGGAAWVDFCVWPIVLSLSVGV